MQKGEKKQAFFTRNASNMQNGEKKQAIFYGIRRAKSQGKNVFIE